MKRISTIAILAIFVFLSVQVVYAASLSIKCPTVIASIGTKIFYQAKGKYKCFNSASDAKKSGYVNESSLKKQWKAVTTLSGTVDKTTDPFTIKATQWRMRWVYGGEGNFAIVVYDAIKNEYKKLVVNTIGATTESSNYYGSGRFYLDVGADSDWSVMIEEYL